MNNKSFVLVAVMALVLVGCNKEKEEGVETVADIEQQQTSQQTSQQTAPSVNNGAVSAANSQQQITPQAPQEAVVAPSSTPAADTQSQAQPTQVAPISEQQSQQQAAPVAPTEPTSAPKIETHDFVTAPSSGVSSDNGTGTAAVGQSAETTTTKM